MDKRIKTRIGMTRIANRIERELRESIGEFGSGNFEFKKEDVTVSYKKDTTYEIHPRMAIIVYDKEWDILSYPVISRITDIMGRYMKEYPLDIDYLIGRKLVGVDAAGFDIYHPCVKISVRVAYKHRTIA